MHIISQAAFKKDFFVNLIDHFHEWSNILKGNNSHMSINGKNNLVYKFNQEIIESRPVYKFHKNLYNNELQYKSQHIQTSDLVTCKINAVQIFSFKFGYQVHVLYHHQFSNFNSLYITWQLFIMLCMNTFSMP